MHMRRPAKLLALTLVLTAALATPALAQSPDEETRIWLPWCLSSGAQILARWPDAKA